MLRKAADFALPAGEMHLHAFSICLRDPDEVGFPRRDRRVQDFLETAANDTKLFEVKASLLVRVLLEQLNSRLGLVDSIGDELSHLAVDDQLRQEFLCSVVAQAQEFLEAETAKTDAQRREDFVAAANKLMPTIQRRVDSSVKAYFVLALDEVNSLSTSQLMAFRRLFCIESDARFASPARLWLVVAGNNTSINLAAPVPGDSGSGRIDARQRVHFEPFVAFHALPDPKTPFKIDSIGTLNETVEVGRPLFKVMNEVNLAEGLDSDASARRLQALVMQKLLGPEYATIIEAARVNGKLSERHGLALLVFRVAFHNTQNATNKGKRELQKRLRAILDQRAFAFAYLISPGEEVSVVFPLEPCIASACSEQVPGLWPAAIQSLANTFFGEVVSPGSGDLGEILAQLWILAAIDATPRTSPSSSACAASAFLQQLLPVANEDAINAVPGTVNFRSFHELLEQKESVSQAFLLARFRRSTAVMGAVGQSKWDLIIPVHCRLPGQDVVREEKMTAIFIQVKNKREGPPPPDSWGPPAFDGPGRDILKIALWVEMNGADRADAKAKVEATGDVLHIHLWNRFDRHQFRRREEIKELSNLIQAAPPSSSVEGVADALARIASGGLQ